MGRITYYCPAAIAAIVAALRLLSPLIGAQVAMAV